jgi:hypothetical protein
MPSVVVPALLPLGFIVLVGIAYESEQTTISPNVVRAAAQDATPSGCGGFPYTVNLVAAGVVADPDETEAMLDLLDAVDGRVANLESLVVAVISPPRLGDDGTIVVDLRLYADTQDRIEPILTTQAILEFVDTAKVNVAVGAEVPESAQYTPIVANLDLDGAYLTSADGEMVLRVVLNEEGVGKLTAYGTETDDPVLAVLLDRLAIDLAFAGSPVPRPVPTAVDVRGMDVEEAYQAAIELRAGPLPAPLAATFEPRAPESWCR